MSSGAIKGSSYNFTLSSGSTTNLATNLVPISNTEIYIIIGVIAAVVVIGGVVVLMRRK